MSVSSSRLFVTSRMTMPRCTPRLRSMMPASSSWASSTFTRVTLTFSS
ncbi:hypothetical protein [Sphingomonas jinjuensis]|nr:hypothetical protein [Sphingomonas jinjuensis]